MLLQLYYVLRSILLRGPIASWRLWRAEQKGDQEFGIETGGFVQSKSQKYYHYQGASYLVLEKIFREIRTMTDCRHFTDIGCGMGRVVFVAEAHGFTHLTGIELNMNLYQAAIRNAERYSKRQQDSVITFLHANVLDFQFPAEACVYFLFNPFDDTVLGSMLSNLRNSISGECWIVYMNPLYSNVFDMAGIPVKHKIRTGFYTEALFYQLVAEGRR